MRDVIDKVIDRCRSATNDLAVDVEGFTSYRVKRMLNELVANLPENEAYLEIGCFKGATLIAALTGNHPTAAYACDNWSEYQSREAFLGNLKRHTLPKVEIIESDCFKFPLSQIQTPVGVYFYDGDHSAANQQRAITHFWPVLANAAIIAVDDWNWPKVRQGTWAAFTFLQPVSLRFVELPARCNGDVDLFHNGIGLFYVNKTEWVLSPEET